MMKIHTTQNLNSLAKSTNMLLSKDVRYSKHSENTIPSNAEESTDSYNSIAFKGKKSVLDKAVKAGKKTLGERVANWKWVKKSFNSNSFGKALEFTTEQEVMIQAITALAICCGLRPATIMALPGDKNKKDCAYAAAHSFSSGVWGFIVPFLFIKPLANGYNYALKNAGEYIKDSAKLKRMWSHLAEDSISGADGIRKPMKEWLDTQGNKFIPDIKDVRKIPKPKHISEISKETLEKYIPGIDYAKTRGISANEWAVNGEKFKLNLEDMYIAVEELVKDKKGKDKILTHYFPLMHVEENVLKEIYPEVNIASTVGKDGRRLHPEKWLKEDGSAFKMNKDHIFISDWAEADDGVTFVTGKLREEAPGKYKAVCYQKNNDPLDPWSKGSEITQGMVKHSAINAVRDKLGAWLPDIVVAYPRATATIAIIPFVLQNVLGLEKSKKPSKAPAVEAQKPAMPVEAQRKVVA